MCLRNLLLLGLVVLLVFTSWPARTTETDLPAERVKVIKDYLNYLRISSNPITISQVQTAKQADQATLSQKGIEQIEQDSEQQDIIRKLILSSKERGLIAMEELGEPLLKWNLSYKSRYRLYWRTYTYSASIDVSEVGRPRLGRFLGRSDVPLQVKVWILDCLCYSPYAPQTWLPEPVLLDIFEELFKTDKIVAYWRGCIDGGTHTIVKKLPNGKISKETTNNTRFFSLKLTGCDFATAIIQNWYSPEIVDWPREYEESPDVTEKRKKAAIAAGKWVDERRIRYRLKESLFAALEHHKAIGLEKPARQRDAINLLLSLSEKSNRTDIRRLMLLYLREVNRDAGEESLKELLGKAISALCGRERGTCKPPGSDEMSSVESAREWLLIALDSCRKESNTFFERREWELLQEKIIQWEPSE